MPLALQTRLLKVLQEKRFVRPGDTSPVEVDVRILAASSEKMDSAVAEKRMHADLYYRFSAFTVHIPALRHRKDEIGLLLRYSMHKVAKYYALSPRSFTPATLEACQNYSWPGNLKELETFVKRYLIAGDEQLPNGEPEVGAQSGSQRPYAERSATAQVEVEGVESSSPKSLKSMVQSVRWQAERNAIAAALEKTGWNRKAASRLLGVSYRTILYKIEQYEMSAPASYLPSLSGERASFSNQTKGNGKAS
jgi:two-component system response regulator AtoC